MTNSKSTILVAVDYSDSAIVAVDQAIAFAAHRVPAVVVPMLVLPGGPATSPEVAVVATEELVTQSKQNLRTLVEKRLALAGSPASLGHQGLSIEPAVVFGDPAERIVQYARQVSAELIVVGTHGRRGVQHLLLGSVAGEIARKAECSVLVARGVTMPTEGSSEPPWQVDPEALPSAPAADWILRDCVVSEPHLEAESVVVHVLDRQSGRAFECHFQDLQTLSIESLEREWVIPATGEQRARAAHAALAFSRAEQALFEQLFGELARRKLSPL